MIRAIKCEPHHFDMFKARAIFAGEAGLENNLKQLVLQENTIAFTWIFKDEIIGCVGITELWDGVWQLWAWLSDVILKCARAFTKELMGFTNFHFEKLNASRFQVYVKADEEKAIRWAGLGNFKVEGCLKKFIGGNDYLIMGRVV